MNTKQIRTLLLGELIASELPFKIESDSLILQKAETLAKEKLQSLAEAPDFISKMKLTFGENADPTKLQADWGTGDFTVIPKIEVRSPSEINGANGAYAAAIDRIFISQDFLYQNARNIEAIASVVLEEIGHAVDSQLNVLDSPGDEGEIFSSLAQGIELSELKLQRLKAEDDTVTVNVDGQNLQIEQATSVFVNNLPSANGVLVDSQENVLVSMLGLNEQTLQNETLIAKFTSNGQLINAKIFGFNRKIKMAAAPSLGGAIGLQDDGLVFRLDTNTLTGYPLFNIRQLPTIDTSAVYDYTTDFVYKPGSASGVSPQTATYNDIAVRENGSVTELFLTGDSIGSGLSPFIMRIRLDTREAKVLISGHRAGIAPQLPSPGIAVNPQGKVITTLPKADYLVTHPHLITFSADFNLSRLILILTTRFNLKN
ncbi:hypothetical protein PCC7424_5616 (plasmid) [Gloeothece citriformis PCC 7424]|uniref:Uncharacterized protein n=1 Tax=Gloeothece citriformis (strain PCC 7424) TaxID=65393 RepID=B7KN03_GLOC7|nr:hypothetical protein [Gloeothece citriformis]ACK74175.1 hypothetical protein PCC7424_5616 [Gloeothece citriformis PCC 7424]